MNPEMKIISEVSNQADIFYDYAMEMGDYAAHAFRSLNSSKQNSHRSQMTSLENIAESALKRSDVFDYIKKQVAKHDYWRKPLPGQQGKNVSFGEYLKTYLEEKLLANLTAICDNLKIGDTTDNEKQQRRRIHLLLMRQFIRQMVAQYEFRVSGIGNLSSAGSSKRGS